MPSRDAILALIGAGAQDLGASMKQNKSQKASVEAALRKLAMDAELHQAQMGKLDAETRKLLQPPQDPRPPQTISPGQGLLGKDGSYSVPIPAQDRTPTSEPLVAIVGPGGKPVLVRRGQAEGKAPYVAPRETAPQRIPSNAVEKEIGVDNMISQAVDVQKALSAAIKDNVDVTGRAGGVIPTPSWFKNADMSMIGMGPKGGQRGVTTRQAIGSLKATIAKERAGTSMTPGELDLLESYVPHENEDETTALRKANGFLRALQQIKQNRAAAYKRYGYGQDEERQPDRPPLPNPEY